MDTAPQRRTCSVPGCGNKHRACGLCSVHYKRAARNGGDTGLKTLQTDQARLEHHRVTENGCWVHLGPYTPKGYGRVSRYGLAHRFYYEKIRGPIPAGLTVDHLCRNRPCVNPAHMELVTAAENTRRMHLHG